MHVEFTYLPMDAANLGGVNPLPQFRSEDPDRPLQPGPHMTPKEAEGLGRSCGDRMLPYLRQDRYDRSIEKRPLPVCILENEHLRATVLCGYGGRLYSLFDKDRSREVLFRNPVIQPCNLAIRDAWLSGGIEWNIGQLGHTFTTCSPMFCARMTDGDGQQFLRIYEYERQKRVFWQVDMHLPSGSRQLLYYVRIVNDGAATPMYWWSTTAVPEDASTRVFASASRTMFKVDDVTFDMGEMPRFPSLSDKDLSYTLNLPCSNDFFLQTPEEERAPWEAAAYGDGSVSFERSTALLRYRKIFCWGDLPGGWRWKDYLSRKGEGSYIEIQAGIGRSQLHGFEMPGDTVWDFTCAVGAVDADIACTHGVDWHEGNAYMAELINSTVSADDIYAAHAYCAALGDKAPDELLYYGSGWGALERKRREAEGASPIPAGYLFPDDSLTDEQTPWLTLLTTGALPEGEPVSYMTDPAWQRRLETSPDSWQKYYHLGVMAVEAMQRGKGCALIDESLLYARNVWNLRAAAVLCSSSTQAQALYAEACAIGFPDIAFAQEYLALLCNHGQYAKASAVFAALPAAWQDNSRVQIEATRAALAQGDTSLCDAGFFERTFPNIRECETVLTDLWYEHQALLLSRERGVSLDDALRDEVRRTLTPPRDIDFRMA